MSSNKFQFMYISILCFLLVVSQCCLSIAEKTESETVVEVCQSLKLLDDRITKSLKELPKNGGESLLKDMQDYNTELAKLEQLLICHRKATLECSEAVELMKEGAPDYFHVNIDRDAGMANFGWPDFDAVFKQRAASITIWIRINRRSRVIELEYYTYPENTTYTGYVNTMFPPMKEKLTEN